jgi:SAM-dependent methyltransferase
VTDPPRARRLVFGEVAEQYDRARPDYPPELFDDVLAFARFGGGDRVLEVGAGTGKATVALGASGVTVVALEPSPEMAAVARRRCAALDRVVVVERGFEEWSRTDGAAEVASYAVVAAAQSWHWIDPTVRLAMARAALRDGGAVGLFWNQPSYPDARLRRAIDDAYRELAPGVDGRFASGSPRVSDGQQLALDELAASELFDDFHVREYRRAFGYDRASYTELLGTHSDHRLLDDDRRLRLLDRVGGLVGDAGGMTVEYLTTLALARRRGGGRGGRGGASPGVEETTWSGSVTNR